MSEISTPKKRSPIRGSPLKFPPKTIPHTSDRVPKPGELRIAYMSSINEKIIKKKRERKKRRKRPNSDEIDEDLEGEKRIKIPFRQYVKWKPVAESSYQYMLNVVADNCSLTLNKTVPKFYQDVDRTLFELRHRVSEKFLTLHTPVPVAKDYQRLQNLCQKMEEELEVNIKQSDAIDREVERLDREVDLNENNIDKTRQRLQDLQRNLNDRQMNLDSG